MNSFQMCSNLIHSFCFSFSGKIIIGIPQKNNNTILKKMRTLYWNNFIISNAHKVKFSIKDFFSKSDQIRRKPRIWSYLLKKSLMENFIFCAVCGEADCFQDIRFLIPIQVFYSRFLFKYYS